MLSEAAARGRTVVEAHFDDEFTIRRPADDADADGNVAGPPTVIATVFGTLTVRGAAPLTSAAQDRQQADATISCPIGTDLEAGDLVDAGGRTWRTDTVVTLRTRMRAELTRVSA